MPLAGSRLDERFAEARVDVPVDTSQVIARGVGTVVGELESTRSRRPRALAGEPGKDRPEVDDAEALELA